MKSILALTTLVLALSLCNLMGRRANKNDNANSRQSGNSSETSASSSPQQDAGPLESTGTGMAPPSQKPGSSRTGNPATIPGVSQATPRTTPRAPISGGVMNGKATSLPQPVYPPIARAAHASGQVNVQVVIDESGNVLTASAVSGHPLLKQSAVQAARQAKFRPTLLSGQPVKVTGIIVYNFVAQ